MAYFNGRKVLLGLRQAEGGAKNLINLDPNDGYESGKCYELNNYGGIDEIQGGSYATSGFIPVTPGKKYIYAHEQNWNSGKYSIALLYYTDKSTRSSAVRYPTDYYQANRAWFFTVPANINFVRLPLGTTALPASNGTSVMYELR